MADPYSILGVARGASEGDIKSAYRKLAKELHPDRNKDNPKAAERFSQVSNAYDLLSDKDRRARFDRGEIDGDGNPTSAFGQGGFGGNPFGGGRSGNFEYSQGGGSEFSDIFEGLFGGGRQAGGFGRGRSAPPSKGPNVEYRLAVDFTDAATRASQRVTLQDGKTIDLKLPAGLESGMQVRVPGKGQQGPGGPGDALVTLEIRSHRYFSRDGDDVRVNLPITLAEAVAGGKVKVPTVDGPVMLAIPAGTTSGKTFRLKGKGFSRKDGERGDQLVTVMIDIPADDLALRQFVEGWQDGRNVRDHMSV